MRVLTVGGTGCRVVVGLCRCGCPTQGPCVHAQGHACICEHTDVHACIPQPCTRSTCSHADTKRTCMHPPARCTHVSCMHEAMPHKCMVPSMHAREACMDTRENARMP
eukprot:365399-Chlamydomonas_euryale.AAC.14